MKCGVCKTYGVDIAHVKACSKHAPTTTEPVVTRTPVTEAGMYRKGETIFKVQKAVHGSGHLYAKRLHVLPSDRAVRGEWVKATFEYAPGALKTLAAEDRLTLEEAKTYGALYGTCIVCGRTLTDEKSIAAGIGPVCASKV